MNTRSAYCGRFAPSPSGPLHFGSLIAAVGSYLDARHRRGKWLLRIEDLDAPRSPPGASADILRTLELFGLLWDEEVIYQSARSARYEEALERLDAQSYGCACSRKEIEDSRSHVGTPMQRVMGERPYPGTCRDGLPPGRVARSVRLRVEAGTVQVQDAIQGRIRQDVAAEVGDFIIKRADRMFAYQLAVVVDDAEQCVSDVVRGADLLASTPRQVYLQRILGLPTPRYKHLPVAATPAGEKLSKQTRARPISCEHPPHVLVKALRFLGQKPPPSLIEEDAETILRWAVERWSAAAVPRVPALVVDEKLELC
jgi:glutamyl-Q tRNA(Asp) synthetase